MKIFHLSIVKFIELTIDDMFINSLIAILIAAKHFVVGGDDIIKYSMY